MAYVNTLPSPPEIWMGEMLDKLRQDRLLALMEHRQGLIDRYSGDNLEDYTKEYFKAPTFKEVPPARQNIMDRLIRKLALVYKNQPEYVFGPDPPPAYNQIKRWQFFRNAERMANLLGTILLHPFVRNEELTWEVVWWYIPLFGEDPFVPEAIMYPLDVPGENKSVRWAYWDAEQHMIMDANGVRSIDTENNPDELNPYGVLPFVNVHIRPQVDEYFVTGYGDSLADVNDSLNVTLTEMRLGARFNLMGQWVASGVNPDKNISLGTDKVPRLPEGGKLEAISPAADMAGAVEYLRAEYENTAQNLGQQVQWGTTADQPSAESIKAKMIEPLERREDDVVVWSVAEEEAYDLEKIVWEKGGLASKLPEKRSVNFAEIEFPLSPEEQRDRDDWNMKHGFSSAAAILMRENPDGYEDEDDAKQKIIENKALNRELGFRSGDAAEEKLNFLARRQPERV